MVAVDGYADRMLEGDRRPGSRRDKILKDFPDMANKFSSLATR